MRSRLMASSTGLAGRSPYRAQSSSLLLSPLWVVITGACMPGHGDSECRQCEPGFFSIGGDVDVPHRRCKPCGTHLTSPPGAIAADYCECVAGYGADRIDVPMEERTCVPCAYGTYNPGSSAANDIDATPVGIAALRPTAVRLNNVPQILACQQCSSRNPAGGFTTLEVGAKSSSQCLCKPGHAGLDCAACTEVGTAALPAEQHCCQMSAGVHTCSHNPFILRTQLPCWTCQALHAILAYAACGPML